MIIGSPAERVSSEARVAMTPKVQNSFKSLVMSASSRKVPGHKLVFLMRPIKKPG